MALTVKDIFGSKIAQVAMAATFAVPAALGAFTGAAQAEPNDGITIADVANMPRNEALAYIIGAASPHVVEVGRQTNSGTFQCVTDAFSGVETNSEGQLVVPDGVEYAYAYVQFLNNGGQGNADAERPIQTAVSGWATRKCGAQLAAATLN